MTRLVLALFLIALPAGVPADDAGLTDLDSLRWKHRVVLIDARGEDAGNARASLQAATAGVAERDILWFIIGDNGQVFTNHPRPVDEAFGARMSERHFAPSSAVRVVLIGKDGGVKSRSQDLDLEEIFGAIDRMPMRKREMRRAPG